MTDKTITDKNFSPLVIGNWKMHGLLSSAIPLAQGLRNTVGQEGGCEVVLCPPATLLYPLAEILSDSAVRLGGQDCHYAAQGAYTGDISAAMLKELSCDYVIVGHSERRACHQENNALVRKKAEAAIQAGIIPVICIGESEEERAAGRCLFVITTQLRESMPANATPENTVIAYEPVWAIGTGKVPNENEIGEVHQAITHLLPERFRILYGGSVKPANAASILSIRYVDGLLVGGCSLNADEFLHIIQSASIDATAIPLTTNH